MDKLRTTFCPLFRGCSLFRGGNVYRQGMKVLFVYRVSIIRGSSAVLSQ